MLAFVLLLGSVVSLQASINFLAVGDWGGDDTSPYYTEAQVSSVKGMDKIATTLQAEFILALGDNFYHSGVVNEYDTRFQTTFENVYTPESLQKNWYVVAGNHDHYGNVTGEIAYTPYSNRWVFPSSYYAKSFESSDDGVTIDIIFIDTVELASKTLKQRHEEGYFDPLPLLDKAVATTQWQWIENQLASSKADFLLVAGHYPVYSICEHGPTATLVTNLLPLLKQYNAHYVNGHDHCMEHIVEVDSNVNHFLSGMGVECCYKASNKLKIPTNSLQWYIAADNKGKNTAGFSSFEVSKSGMTVKYYNQDGTLLYTAPAVPPRN
eukprot:gene12043-13157_t